MKKVVLMVAIALGALATSFAQEGGRGNWGGQRKTIAERVAEVHAKFDSVFKFSADKQAKIDSAFSASFNAQQELRKEMMSGMTPGERPDPSVMEKMQERMKEIQVARDEKLQEIMTEEEYTKFKKELEPLLMPRRGMGGPGGGRGRDGK